MKKAALIFAAFALLVGGLVYVLERPTEGVEPIVWDEATCAHCHMHLGDPHYAAQLQTVSGQVHNFDDPGCLFEYVEQNRPEARATYFHHHRKDQWIPREAVGFVEVDEDTPMGYGIGAVERANHPEAMGFEQAQRSVTTANRPADREESR